MMIKKQAFGAILSTFLLFVAPNELLGKKKCHSSSSSSNSSTACSFSSEKNMNKNWASYGRDLKNTRRNNTSKINRCNVYCLQEDWIFQGDASFTGNPSVVDGIAYIGDFSGNVYALDAETGTQLWKTSVSVNDARVFLTPAVGKDRIYVGTDDFPPQNSAIYALDKVTGAILWQKSVTDLGVNAITNGNSRIQGAITPLEEENLIFCATVLNPISQIAAGQFSSGLVIALDADTGAKRWVYNTTRNPVPGQPNSGGPGVGIFATPALDTKTGRLFIGTGQNYQQDFTPPDPYPFTPNADALLCLNYRTNNPDGELIWSTQFTSDDLNIVATHFDYRTKATIIDNQIVWEPSCVANEFVPGDCITDETWNAGGLGSEFLDLSNDVFIGNELVSVTATIKDGSNCIINRAEAKIDGNCVPGVVSMDKKSVMFGTGMLPGIDQIEIEVRCPARFQTDGKNWDADGGPILMNVSVDGCCKEVAIIGVKDGRARALDRNTGEIVWETFLVPPPPAGTARGKIDPNCLPPIGSGLGGVNTFGATDGKVVYFSAIFSKNGQASQFLFDFEVFGYSVFALEASTGKILWSRDFVDGGDSLGALVYGNGVLYTMSDAEIVGQDVRAVMRALCAKTGKTLFEYLALPGIPSTSGVTTYKDRLFWSDFLGQLISLKLDRECAKKHKK